jgi:CheY-like chemotaxis protein
MIEGNAVYRKLVLNQLQKLGYLCEAANSAQEVLAAMQASAHNHYALVLVGCPAKDRDLPELIHAVRAGAEPDKAHIPVVLLVAPDHSGPADECQQLGADDILNLPVSLSSLKSVLQRWMVSSEKPGSEQQTSPDGDQIAPSNPTLQADAIISLPELGSPPEPGD